MLVSVSEAKGQLTNWFAALKRAMKLCSAPRQGRCAARAGHRDADGDRSKGRLEQGSRFRSKVCDPGSRCGAKPGLPLRRRRAATVIAVDTSALMAVILDEPPATACIRALESAPALVISAATVAEALIVATTRGVSAEMQELADQLGFEIVPVSAATAKRVGDIYRKWGRDATRQPEFRRLFFIRHSKNLHLPVAVRRL